MNTVYKNIPMCCSSVCVLGQCSNKACKIKPPKFTANEIQNISNFRGGWGWCGGGYTKHNV